MAAFERHDFVWLAEKWRDHLPADLPPADRESLQQWISRDRPLIVARPREGDDPAPLRLGLALPQRRRIGVTLPHGAVERHAPPPSLAEIAPSLPAGWQKIAARLLAAVPCPVAAFGSAVWQYFAADTGMIYLTAESDLDLLFYPRDEVELRGLPGILQAVAADHPAPRLDGEIRLQQGGFVAWREWAMQPEQLLVKYRDRVEMVSRTTIEGCFA